MDNILIVGKSDEEHLCNQEETLSHLKKATRTSGNQWMEKMEVKCSTEGVEVAVEMTLASVHFE